MASKAATLARELKSLRSDLRFMQERSALLEEENRRLRDGFDKGIPPEEDDLVMTLDILTQVVYYLNRDIDLSYIN